MGKVSETLEKVAKNFQVISMKEQCTQDSGDTDAKSHPFDF